MGSNPDIEAAVRACDLCRICGEQPISETCPDCGATGCEACLDGHLCVKGSWGK